MEKKLVDKGLGTQALKLLAEDTQVGGMTNWRKLKNPQGKKVQILKGLDFIQSFIHRGLVVQSRKIIKGY